MFTPGETPQVGRQTDAAVVLFDLLVIFYTAASNLMLSGPDKKSRVTG